MTLKPISLRLATAADAALLLEWRNDPETCAQSKNSAPLDPDSHIRWLAETLESESRQLFIALEDNVPVGTIRYDVKDRFYELSWVVAPLARGRGLGKRIVTLLIERVPGPFRAFVREGNVASIKIAQFVGMTQCGQEGPFIRFESV